LLPLHFPVGSGLQLVTAFEVVTENFLLLYHRMHLQLGVMNRFVLYIQDFSASPGKTWEEKGLKHFRETYGPDELHHLETGVYNLLYNILKKYAETAYIFVDAKTNTHRSASCVCLALMDNIPLDQPLLHMKFLIRTILTLDGVWFNFDQIFVALYLFYFQTHNDLVYKKVTSVIQDHLRPMTDPSQINHKVLTSNNIRTFHKYVSTTTKVFKVVITGSVQPHVGCKG
jgi:hypothetical protein